MSGSQNGSISAVAAANSPTLPLGQLLVQAARRFGDSPHLLIPGQGDDHPFDTQTFAGTLAGAKAVATGLRRSGMGIGEPVAFLGDCTAGRFATAFGIWLAGGVVVALDPEWGETALARALTKVRARFGIVDQKRTGLLREASRAIQEFVCLNEEEALSDAGPAYLPGIDPRSRALIVFTSGTTGEPKAAVMEHRGLLWNTRALSESLGVTPEDSFLGGLPLHHMVGLVATVLLPAFSGARVALPRSLTGLDIFHCMRTTGVTLVATVPQLLAAFDRAIQSRVKDALWPRRALFAIMTRGVRASRHLGFNPGPYLFRSIHEAFGGQLRLLGSGSAPLDPDVGRRLWSVGLNVVEGYGLTETGPAICFDNPRHPRFGSVGVSLKGVDLRIHQPDSNGVGEILVRSPARFEGYLDDPEATAEILRDGWIYTGDLGRLDGAGRLYLTGRKKEVVVLGSGLKINPQEVEARLDQNPYIAESCVLGLAADGRPASEKLHAVVVPDFQALRRRRIMRIEATLSNEINRIGDRLPSHHRIMGITLRSDPLPRTPVGKLKRFQVEKDLVAFCSGRFEEPSQPAQPPPESPCWQHVEKALRKISSHRGPVSGSSILELDLGLDSLARIEVLSELEQSLEAKLPEGFGAECLTAGELLKAVEALLEGREEADGAGFQDMSRLSAEVRLHTVPRRLLRPLGLLLLLLLKWPTRFLSRLVWGFRVDGIENIPATPHLICPNHASYADPFLLLMALPLRLGFRSWWLGHERIFRRPVMRFLGAMGNVIRSDPNSGLRTTLALGSAALSSGGTLVLFPEGTRVPTGDRVPYRRGAAILARTAGVPILPVRIEGAGRLLPRGNFRLGFGFRLAVRFGKPIDPKEGDQSSDPVAHLTELLRRRVETLAAR